MPEAFNFTKNLRKVVAPTLRGHGFVQKGAKFLRVRGMLTDGIWFQRSQWNDTTSGDPLQFFLNLKCGIGLEPWNLTDVRVPNPGWKPFPDWWLALTVKERMDKHKSLSPDALKPVTEASRSSRPEEAYR